jgi:hypothetical protein
MLTSFASWTPNLTSMAKSPMNLPKAANGPIGCGLNQRRGATGGMLFPLNERGLLGWVAALMRTLSG